MKRILPMIVQDFKLLLRNAIFWVITVSLVVIVIVVQFLVPGDFSVSGVSLAVYGFSEEIPGAKTMEDAKAVEKYVAETGSAGIINESGKLTLLHTGLSGKAATVLVSSVMPSEALPQADIARLRENPRTAAQNLRLMPMFICFEAIVLGFLMTAVLMLDEKKEQVLRAYRVSPGGTLRYIISKTLLFSLIGAVYALFMAVLTVGFAFDWLQFILLSLLGCALYTLLGMSVAVFFKDISGWFFVAVVILAINMLPEISFSSPSFSPGYLTAIPSYKAIFAYEEILFPTGKSLVDTYILLGAETAAAFALCSWLVWKKLLHAGKEA